MTRLRWDKDRSGAGYRTIYINQKPLEITLKRKEPGFNYSPKEVQMYSPKTLKKGKKKTSQKHKLIDNNIEQKGKKIIRKDEPNKQKSVSRTAIKKSKKQELGKLAGKIIQRRLGKKYKNKHKNVHIIQIIDE
ncbi:hypothetical protein GCM10010965_30820 [Caldalkalibacillus thermarum]|uniref:hypothetical protein n=1 Tax=Caldalkalibacillus thermarum TaxID=296745 RepID=UPI00166C9702|nr:hypothetical protein [Caldalkalibacillus thermarum]GGK35696.1 hypothetical protein GCM10010965_30820 [Caldalkalibacillus thermarum]